MGITDEKVCNACGECWDFHPVLLEVCPSCDADVGRKCQRPSGHRIQTPHQKRTEAALEAGRLDCPDKGPAKAEDW